MLTAVLLCTAFEERDMHHFRIFFGNYPFLLRLYEVYLSLKDLEILGEFILLQNLHLYTQKSVCATSTRPFGEVGRKYTLYHSWRTHFAKIEDKKVIAKN